MRLRHFGSSKRHHLDIDQSISMWDILNFSEDDAFKASQELMHLITITDEVEALLSRRPRRKFGHYY